LLTGRCMWFIIFFPTTGGSWAASAQLGAALLSSCVSLPAPLAGPPLQTRAWLQEAAEEAACVMMHSTLAHAAFVLDGAWQAAVALQLQACLAGEPAAAAEPCGCGE